MKLSRLVAAVAILFAPGSIFAASVDISALQSANAAVSADIATMQVDQNAYKSATEKMIADQAKLNADQAMVVAQTNAIASGLTSPIPVQNPNLPTGLFVSTTGSDSNPGTFASPFLTLTKCQSAMEAGGSTPQICYLRSGTYHLASTFTLGSADANQTWQYYPPDGVNSAVLDGAGTIDMITIGGNGITWNGIKVQNPKDVGIYIDASNVTVKNSDVGTSHDSTEVGGFAPILCVGCLGDGQLRNNQILNNYVHDCLSQGIGAYAFAAGTTIDGLLISGNFVDRCPTSVNDGGSIYIDMRNTNVNGGHVTISNNYVMNYGQSSVEAEGIYLDDDSSNVTVSGNIVAIKNAGAPAKFGNFITNGGCCNTITGNIFDLGPSGNQPIEYNTYPPSAGGAINFTWTTANNFSGNIVISKYMGSTSTVDPLGASASGKGHYQGITLPASLANIANNMYHNYGGGDETTIDQGGPFGDASPQHADPQLSGTRTYTVAAGSPARSAPVNFPSIVGGWGPPGFTIPTDGQNPSYQ